MATASQFAHDLFISYAHIDDEQDALGTRWVSDFVEDLTSALRMLGQMDEVRIFRDARNLEAGHHLEELRTQVRASALLLSIVSPNYVRRKWTMEEFNTFRQATGYANRIIGIDLLPLNDEADYPKAMQELYRPPFFERSKDKNSSMRLGRHWNRTVYAERIQELASHIAQRYREVVNSQATPAPDDIVPLGRAADDMDHDRSPQQPHRQFVNRQSTPAADNVVLLGRVTDDMRNDRSRLRSHLEQFGIKVIPSHDYPDGGASFKEKLKNDLAVVAQARRGAFVQLVGRYPSVQWDEFPNGYERFQLELAAKTRVQTWFWRPDKARQARRLRGRYELAM